METAMSIKLMCLTLQLFNLDYEIVYIIYHYVNSWTFFTKKTRTGLAHEYALEDLISSVHSEN